MPQIVPLARQWLASGDDCISAKQWAEGAYRSRLDARRNEIELADGTRVGVYGDFDACVFGKLRMPVGKVQPSAARFERRRSCRCASESAFLTKSSLAFTSERNSLAVQSLKTDCKSVVAASDRTLQS